MELSYIFIVGSSLTLLFIVAISAVINIKVAGSKAFLLQIVFVAIWSIGSLLEMLSTTEQEMLLWRNIEQIGVFLLPVACVYFSVDYARYDRLKKYLPLLLIVPVAAIVLIFTDSSTHIMRSGYTISTSPLFGEALSVHQTVTGVLFVSYNYLLVFISLVILFIFSRQISRGLRRQVILVLVATGLVFVLAFFKTAFLEGTRINLPIVTIYLPSGLIMFYNLYKNEFFRVSPIARDKVFDVVEMGLLVTDVSGTIVDLNPYANRILRDSFGIQKNLSGKRIDEVFREFPEWVELVLPCASGETELQIAEKGLCLIHLRVYPLQSHRGISLGSVTIMRDVTDVRRQEFALKRKAETDSLTGLLNRDSFLKALAEELRNSAKSGTRVSVMMMDLDKFKQVNDTHGHINGDRVLKAVSSVLKSVLRQEDAVARIGGDEFAAILPNTDCKEAAVIADRILAAAGRKAVTLDTQVTIPLKLSIGICDDSARTTADEMLKHADLAMYQAKSCSGNRSVTWVPPELQP